MAHLLERYLNVAKDVMADIPQSLYEAMIKLELACNGVPYL
jgi:hypothetical protein